MPTRCCLIINPETPFPRLSRFLEVRRIASVVAVNHVNTNMFDNRRPSSFPRYARSATWPIPPRSSSYGVLFPIHLIQLLTSTQLLLAAAALRCPSLLLAPTAYLLSLQADSPSLPLVAFLSLLQELLVARRQTLLGCLDSHLADYLPAFHMAAVALLGRIAVNHA